MQITICDICKRRIDDSQVNTSAHDNKSWYTIEIEGQKVKVVLGVYSERSEELEDKHFHRWCIEDLLSSYWRRTRVGEHPAKGETVHGDNAERPIPEDNS